MAADGTRIPPGAGRILGSPGIFHLPRPHQFEPSPWYGSGSTTDALCDRARGVVYAEDTLANLYPNDRLCRFCERRANG